MAEILPSITTEQTSNSSESPECKDDQQSDESNNKRKLDEDENSQDEVPEKKVKSEAENENKKLEDNENPIIEEEHPVQEPADPEKTVSVKAEITEKEESSVADGKSEAKKKVQNMRKNIKEVIDDTQLDANTLAAQRQESERLARIQEQQKHIREQQRQIAVEKQQQKVMSILQVDENEQEALTDDPEDSIDPILKKFSLKSSDDIKEAAKATLESIKSLITSDLSPESDEGEDDDCIIQPTSLSPDPLSSDKPKTVIVDSSSDSDDCIMLSDEESEESFDEDVSNSGAHTNDLYNVQDSQGRVVVNIVHGENEPDIFVAPQIARIIKPHQIGGVRFLYDNIIESTEIFDKSTGFGCILAHSMGLGKTLQMVCFCDIFLRHTSSKKILLIMPINTLQNWLNEFNMWLPLPDDVEKNPLAKDGEVRARTFRIFVLNESFKSLTARANVVLDWSKEGGVLIMGYEMYRLLSMKKMRQKKKKGVMVDTTTSRDREMFDNIYSSLVCPGPDLVVCDEGHRIKNSHATTSHALKQIKTKRRVVLTGYPLQNNLLEYWCMVDFVRPSYLGTKTEFYNMFERPIQNGQCIDSTPNDFKLMRYRAHVLHSLLKGFVQRRSHTVLHKALPEKTEYVILVRMTKFQRRLYEVFMNEVVRSKKVPNPLKAFAVCCKIWNHPDVLYHFLKKRELDLDLEVEEPETENSSKKDKRNSKDSKSDNVLKTLEMASEAAAKLIKEENQIPTPMTPSNPDSDYSSTQSSFDSSNSSYYSNFQNYDNQYQNNWNGKYYQENYYPQTQANNFYSQNSQPASFYANASHQFNNLKPEGSQIAMQLQLASAKNEKPGGLLQDVIEKEKQEEVKELPSGRGNKDDGIPYDWAIEIMKDYIPDLLENSPKMELFFCILNESVKMGDRILVFSQSLLTLNVLEKFLQSNKIPGKEENWAKNTSYFRLDGSTSALDREKLITEFNSNSQVKLFLVSTRAGSLGINLVGANRVVVFDASWNPCHDTQAVCRVYRYGQAKSCFVYRLVMDNCLEKKIYDRQINKQGMADRIIDECNPDAHLSIKEITSLCYGDGVDPDFKDFNDIMDNFLDVPTKKILIDHSKALTKEPFPHESLLVDRKESKLSIAEKRLAQRGYEMEKQAASKPSLGNYANNVRMYRSTDGTLIQRPHGSGRPNPSDFAQSEIRNLQPEKSTRWVPIEVWQSKGISAQEMTLPQDVAIQTNSTDKAKIYLRAGQKVIVLKSPKGVCLQLQSGKIIAIRASQKPGLANLNALTAKVGDPRVPLKQDGDVIDISNDDDDDESSGSVNKDLDEAPVNNSENSTQNGDSSKSEASKSDNMYKENRYKPNLLPRKPKILSSASNTIPPISQPMHNSMQKPSSRWEASSSQLNISNHTGSSYNNRNGNSSQYRHGNYSEPTRNSSSQLPSASHNNASSFYQPFGSQYPQSSPPSNQMYQGSSFTPSSTTYPQGAQHTNSSYNYNPYPSYPNQSQTSTYSSFQQTPSTGYDSNYPQYQTYNSYPPVPPNNHASTTYPPLDTSPPPTNPYTNSSNYSQWNYNT